MAVEWSAEPDAAAASLSTQSLSHASGVTWTPTSEVALTSFCHSDEDADVSKRTVGDESESGIV